MSLFLIWSMCWTFELIVKQYAYSCKCVVKKLHSWFLINRVKSFPTFFTPSHCLFLFATQHQKSASCTGFQCSFQIIQCRSQLNLQWFSCEQMGHQKGTPFPPVNPVKSQEINSDLEAFLWTFQQKIPWCRFFGEWPGWWLWKVLHPQRKLQPFFAHHYCRRKSGDQHQLIGSWNPTTFSRFFEHPRWFSRRISGCHQQYLVTSCFSISF